MNSFRIDLRKKRRAGFSLVEASFSIGLMSFGFLTLAPMLALGLKTARLARDDRATAQIAGTLIAEARQGTLSTGKVYLDIQGTTVASARAAAYSAQSASVPSYQGNPALTQASIRITPIGAPDRSRIYAAVFQTPPAVP